MSGKPKSAEHRTALSNAKRGKPPSDKHLAAMRAASELRRGYTHTAEARAKMSAKRRDAWLRGMYGQKVPQA